MAKLNFQHFITPVFSVTWSFRNHSNMLICCLHHRPPGNPVAPILYGQNRIESHSHFLCKFPSTVTDFKRPQCHSLAWAVSPLSAPSEIQHPRSHFHNWVFGQMKVVSEPLSCTPSPSRHRRERAIHCETFETQLILHRLILLNTEQLRALKFLLH